MEDQWQPSTCEKCRRNEQRIAALEAKLARLQAALKQAERVGKRQVAPLRKGPPAADPKRPGRKPGNDYSKHARRAAATDEDLDETIDARSPTCCPNCRSRGVRESHVDEQFQIELPQKLIQRRFDVYVGCCGEFGERL